MLHTSLNYSMPSLSTLVCCWLQVHCSLEAIAPYTQNRAPALLSNISALSRIQLLDLLAEMPACWPLAATL